MASDDRDPIADNPPYFKNTNTLQYKNLKSRPPHHGANPPGGGYPPTSSRSRRAIPGESLGPVSRAGDPARELPDGRGPEYPGGAWAEDRATRGRDPSADPGAKTGAGGRMPPLGIPGLAPTR